MVTADRRELLHPRPHPPAHLPRSSIRPYGPMITAGWGHFRPSQPPRRVDRWAQLKPSRRHLTDSQVGPPRAVTLGPDQAVTASLTHVAPRARRATRDPQLVRAKTARRGHAR